MLEIFNVHVDAYLLTHAIAHTEGCTNTTTESVVKIASGRKIPFRHRRMELASVMRVAFRSDAFTTEPHPVAGNIAVSA